MTLQSAKAKYKDAVKRDIRYVAMGLPANAVRNLLPKIKKKLRFSELVEFEKWINELT